MDTSHQVFLLEEYVEVKLNCMDCGLVYEVACYCCASSCHVVVVVAAVVVRFDLGFEAVDLEEMDIGAHLKTTSAYV